MEPPAREYKDPYMYMITCTVVDSNILTFQILSLPGTMLASLGALSTRMVFMLLQYQCGGPAEKQYSSDMILGPST